MRILSKEIKKFENQFMPETTELIVLVKKNLGGAMVVGKYCTPNLYFVAAVNPVTNELYPYYRLIYNHLHPSDNKISVCLSV